MVKDRDEILYRKNGVDDRFRELYFLLGNDGFFFWEKEMDKEKGSIEVDICVWGGGG